MVARNNQKWEASREKPSETQESSEKDLFVLGCCGGGSWGKLQLHLTCCTSLKRSSSQSKSAKHKGAYLNLSVSGSRSCQEVMINGTNFPLPSSCCSPEEPLLSGAFSQHQDAHESSLCGTGSLAQTWLQFISFQLKQSPDMVINHGLTDRALNCLQRKLHIPIQGSPGRTWNLFHLCVIKKWSTWGERINPNFRFIKVSLLCLIKSVLKPPNPKLKT